MTAPGSSPLTLIVVALVVAATGYAGGRLHQWWRTGQDRDAAYREGYDTATRSVFSLAARLIGPRRAPVRGSVIVRSTVIDGGTTVPMPPLTADATPLGRPPAVAGRPPSPAADVPLTDDATWYAWGSAVEDASGYAARADDVRRPASRFPDGPGPIRSNPASHFITGRAPASGERDGDVLPLRRPAADGGLERAGEDAGAVVPPSGRHTVPDELVQAATYRLPPDRVFRAKVRHLAPGEQDSTTRLPEPPVPRPRTSFPPD